MAQTNASLLGTADRGEVRQVRLAGGFFPVASPTEGSNTQAERTNPKPKTKCTMNSEPVKVLPIREIADQLEIPEDYLEYYGKYTAKLRLELLSNLKARGPGKLILVTAMTPTSHGEGKTVVSIGLAQAIQQLGKRSMVTLREPSLGPVFGVKGGATGGGKSKVIPSELINLHFNGDFHAVTSAHNLLAAMIHSHLTTVTPCRSTSTTSSGHVPLT